MNAFYTLILLLCFSFTSQSQNLPYKYKVLEKMVLANKYFMDKWPDPTKAIVTDKTRPSNLWTRATYHEGLLSLYYINRDTSFYKYLVTWGTFHTWGPTYGGTTTRNADNQGCGQSYIELYLLDRKPERIQTIKSCIDVMVNSTISNDWWWIDAFQMAMPSFAKLGVIYNDNKYFERMYDIFNYTRTKPKGVGLYNTTDHLWWRDSTFLPPKTTPNGKQVYWSRGNGWVMTALARVLTVLPANAPHRAEYVSMFQEMASALLPIQRTDGFWNSSLADPNDFGGKETSGTSMFTFAFAWGINNGILDSATYYPSVVKAWNAMIQDALHADGMLGFVQGTGKEPKDGQPLSYDKVANFEDYGLGAFLLAGSEVYKLSKDSLAVITGNKEVVNTAMHTSLKAFPNPFSNNVTISYTIESNTHIELSVYDTNGIKVCNLVSKPNLTPGSYIATWNGVESCGKTSPSGIYVIYLRDGKFIKQLKIELVK